MQAAALQMQSVASNVANAPSQNYQPTAVQQVAQPGGGVRASLVNAGDGTHEHPSQGLLDAMTLREKLGQNLEGKRVLIVGDIVHSRVARSNVYCLRLLGAKVVLCGPPTLLPKSMEALGAEVTWDLDRALGDADAVMMLMPATAMPSALRQPAKLFM